MVCAENVRLCLSNHTEPAGPCGCPKSGPLTNGAEQSCRKLQTGSTQTPVAADGQPRIQSLDCLRHGRPIRFANGPCCSWLAERVLSGRQLAGFLILESGPGCCDKELCSPSSTSLGKTCSASCGVDITIFVVPGGSISALSRIEVHGARSGAERFAHRQFGRRSYPQPSCLAPLQPCKPAEESRQCSK